MNCNIKRHAYVNYNGKPYIYYNGVTYNKNLDRSSPNFNDKLNRTVVRTLLPNKTYGTSVPSNGMGNFVNIAKQTNQIPMYAKKSSCSACNHK